ncbi:MAG: metallophosphoesterase family protein [Epsilonproteobacteria bacterium]|nr:metallophosphoesterase family protein [Campylobacterota bacterium]
MKIGIMSDTHKKTGRAIKAIDYLIDQGAEYIIHAGDIVKKEILDYLEEQIPYIAVFGNNDYHLYRYINQYNLAYEPYKFKLDNHTFKLMHHPTKMFPLDTEVIVYGHTHIEEIVYNGKNLILNPGEVCARDTGYSNCMILECFEDRYEVSYYYRRIKSDFWKEYKKVIQK